LASYIETNVQLKCLSQVFKTVLTSIQEQNVDWYVKLMAPLKKSDLESVQEVFTLCDQRMAARESKNIEKQGGEHILLILHYNFF
jgi:hypothetical protein